MSAPRCIIFLYHFGGFNFLSRRQGIFLSPNCSIAKNMQRDKPGFHQQTATNKNQRIPSRKQTAPYLLAHAGSLLEDHNVLDHVPASVMVHTLRQRHPCAPAIERFLRPWHKAGPRTLCSPPRCIILVGESPDAVLPSPSPF